jgi:hypothetical protein
VGFDVGALTWRDVAAGWPYPLRTVRSDAADPDSVGVTFRRGTVEARIVVFRGGWADVEFADLAGSADGWVMEAPDIADPQTAGAVIDSLLERIDALGSPPLS